jgi:hypothetical protein
VGGRHEVEERGGISDDDQAGGRGTALSALPAGTTNDENTA